MFRWLLLLLLSVAFFFWPYYDTRRFAEAVEKKDAETVKKMVEFDSLRLSMRRLMLDGAMAAAESRIPRNASVNRDVLREKIRQTFESNPIRGQVDAFLTDENLTKMFTAGHLDKGNGGGWRNETWRSFNEFAVQDRDSEMKAVFKLRGTGWKLTGLEVPPAELQRLAAMVPAFQR